MAKLITDFPFTGSLGHASVYKVSRSDKLIVSRKGGNSKERIKTATEFAGIRKVNAESGVHSTATKWTRNGMKVVFDALSDCVSSVQDPETNFSWHAGKILLILCKGCPKVVTYCVQFGFERSKCEGMANLWRRKGVRKRY